MARVQISDNGVGIAAPMLGSIFDMFVQVSDTARIAQGGLGIGLTLVKSLVELHGGSVVASSDGLGRGSCFVVRLPLVAELRPDRSPAPVAIASRSRANRVLVVDDNQEAADTLVNLLDCLGTEARAAYDCEQALRLAVSYRPTVALLDIGMPGMDGYELAARMRATPALNGMKMVALTGWGQSDDRKKIAKAGFDGHLVKPAGIEQIEAFLASPPVDAVLSDQPG